MSKLSKLLEDYGTSSSPPKVRGDMIRDIWKGMKGEGPDWVSGVWPDFGKGGWRRDAKRYCFAVDLAFREYVCGRTPTRLERESLPGWEGPERCTVCGAERTLYWHVDERKFRIRIVDKWNLCNSLVGNPPWWVTLDDSQQAEFREAYVDFLREEVAFYGEKDTLVLVCLSCRETLDKMREDPMIAHRTGKPKYEATLQWDQSVLEDKFLGYYVPLMPPGIYSTYFIQQGECGPIKIGKAYDVLDRREQLQCANSEWLYIVGVLREDLETELHRRFKDICVRGEWYYPRQELIDLIIEHRSPEVKEVWQFREVGRVFPLREPRMPSSESIE